MEGFQVSGNRNTNTVQLGDKILVAEYDHNLQNSTHSLNNTVSEYSMELNTEICKVKGFTGTEK
jgi:hypothetical protein